MVNNINDARISEEVLARLEEGAFEDPLKGLFNATKAIAEQLLTGAGAGAVEAFASKFKGALPSLGTLGKSLKELLPNEIPTWFDTALSAIEFSAYRFGIQNVLLKELPKSIARQIDPDLEPLVDSPEAKVARMLTVASLIALILSDGEGLLDPLVISSFLSGLSAAYLDEVGAGYLESAVVMATTHLLSSL